MPDSHRPATEIPVTSFRQILIWPLLVQNIRSTGDIDLDAVTLNLIDSHWQRADQPLGSNAATLRDRPGYGADHEYDYSEIVYFHSYVRDFLYGGDGGDAGKRPMRTFCRRDIHALKVKLGDTREYELSVNRVEGYLFESGVFLVVVEVERTDKSGKLMLSDALDLQNVVRMVFPRRWNAVGTPSETPVRACWMNPSSEEIMDSVQDFCVKGDFMGIVREEAELPAAKHWRYLVQPFALYGERNSGNFSVRQIVDQRIPSMVYLAVPDPHAISDWDFARIAFFDGAGESSVGPYSDAFLVAWAKKYAYDRFWQRTRIVDSTGEDQHGTMMRTRWLCSGYGFAVVGANDDSVFTDQIAANFRHHYFRMGLIAHFHRATILTFRDQLAEATKNTGKEFRERVMKIQQEFNKFRARFWFREVSTQLQGQEIFAWWSERLGNQALFDQVTADIAAAETQVRTEFEEEEARDIKLITEIGGVIGIVCVLLSAAAFVVSLPSVGWNSVAWRVSSGHFVVDVVIMLVIVVLIMLVIVAALGLPTWLCLRRMLKRQRFNRQ